MLENEQQFALDILASLAEKIISELEFIFPKVINKNMKQIQKFEYVQKIIIHLRKVNEIICLLFKNDE